MTGHSEGQWTNNIIVMQYKIVAMAPDKFDDIDMTLDKTRPTTFGICNTYGFKAKYPPVKLSIQESWHS
jgi:hypothetical protein